MSLDKSLSLVSATKPALVDRKLACRCDMISRAVTRIEIGMRKGNSASVNAVSLSLQNRARMLARAL